MQNVPFIFIMCSSFQLKCVCFGLLHGVVRNWSARLKMQKNYKDSRFSVAISFEWITNNFFLPIPSLLASCSPPPRRLYLSWQGSRVGLITDVAPCNYLIRIGKKKRLQEVVFCQSNQNKDRSAFRWWVELLNVN